MVRKKTVTKKGVRKDIKSIWRAEQRLMRQWNPEIVMVTIVGIILIVGLSAFNGFMMNDMKNKISDLEDQIASGPGTTIPMGEGAVCMKACTFNKDLKIQLSAVPGKDECEEAGKVKIIAFHSLVCPHCQGQVPVLELMKSEFGDSLEVQYVCASNREDCELAVGNYLPYDEGLRLYDEFKLSRDTPTLVINCAFKRIGSYGHIAPDTEKVDLRTLINFFLGNV